MSRLKRKHISSRKKGILIRAVAWTAMAIAVVAAMVLLLKKLFPEAAVKEVYGDLDTRFESSVKLERNGTVYNYREYALENILIIGIDRDAEKQSTSVFRSGAQADFLLLVSMDREKRTITPIQLDRDTITPVNILGVLGDPAGTRLTHLCLAQVYGRTLATQSQNTMKAVSRLLNGVIIDRYITVDLAAINVFNTALGGVKVTIEEDLSYLDPAFTAGATVRLTGDQAETFVRSRRAVLSDPSNAGRMRRQRVYMQAAVETLMAKIHGDSTYGLRLLEQLGDHVSTDIPEAWLLNDLNMYSEFTVQPFYVPEGVHGVDELGFTTFCPDADALLQNEIRLFFR